MRPAGIVMLTKGGILSVLIGKMVPLTTGATVVRYDHESLQKFVICTTMVSSVGDEAEEPTGMAEARKTRLKKKKRTPPTRAALDEVKGITNRESDKGNTNEARMRRGKGEKEASDADEVFGSGWLASRR